MNPTLLLAFWRQRLTSPVRMVVLSAMIFLPLLFIAVMPGMGFAALGESQPLILLFAVGMIGQDVSTGVLQLLFARPVRRWEYVLNRWLGVALAASAVCCLQALLAWGLMSLRGNAPGLDVLLLFAAGRTLDAFGLAAIVTLLSSLIGGYGDLALYVLAMICATIVGLVAQAQGWHVVQVAAQVLSDSLTPRLEMAQFKAGAPSWYAIASYGSSVTLALWLAVVSVNRKELSYASG
jgi:hypothetical protein